MKKLDSISIMFPVYKDTKTVKKMILDSLKILKKFSKKYEIVIVDDGCPENTGKIAESIAKSNNNIRVIFHKKNLGYGAALKTGLKNCKYKWIFQLDGDDQYKVNDLGRLIKASKNFDLVITYRYKKKYETWRIFISWIYNKLLRYLFNTKFLDISTGSRLLSLNLAKKIKLNSNSPFLGAELAIKSKFQGYKVNEIGIHTFPRIFGTGSSVTFKNIVFTIKDMLLLFFMFYLKK